MRTIIWFIYFWMSLLFVFPPMIRAGMARKHGDIAKCDKITGFWVPRWANSLLKLAGVKVTVTGIENLPDETCVFTANHEGYYDIPLVLTRLPKPYGIMAKKETLKIPLVRGWMKNIGCVFVDRNDIRAGMEALNQATENVKNGQSMIVFPEGTRSKNGEIGEFKGGSFRIAVKTGAPIVPLRIEGTRNIMENNGYWMRPGKIELHILPPVETKGLSKEEQRALPEKIRQIIIDDRAKSRQNENN